MTEDQLKDQKSSHGFIRRADERGVMPDDSKEVIEAAVLDLQTNKDAWVELDLQERIAILDVTLDDLSSIADQWVSISVEAKGTRGNAYAEAEEWAFFATVLRNIRLLGASLRDIQNQGRPLIPGSVSARSNGQVVAQVFPQTRWDQLLLPGTTAEVWMQPGLNAEQIYSSQARFYRGGTTGGKVALVLGAGNASMLVPTDFLYKLFVEGQVVLLKTNPVNAYLGPVLEQGFRSIIDRGFLRIVHGGVEIGSYLCNHPSVDEIHTTGSDKTFDDIVFGPGIEGARRKSERKPLIKKRFTAELGTVTPVIIVPGNWSNDDIVAQGEKLASWLVINSGFNCLTPRMIIQWANWEHREALNEAIANALAQVETRQSLLSRSQTTGGKIPFSTPAGQPDWLG